MDHDTRRFVQAVIVALVAGALTAITLTWALAQW